MKNVHVKEYNGYNENEIISLYKSVGWKNYYEKPSILMEAYKNSLCVFGAYRDNDLVGIIRVVGDGYSIIYIQDIIVLPIYQRQGIGNLLVRTILDKYKNVYQTVLLTDNQPNTVRFYENMGLTSADKYNCVSFVNFK